MLRQPTTKDAKKLWKKACKKYGVKPLYLKSWWHKRRIRKCVNTITALLAKQTLDSILEHRFITVGIGSKRYILCPQKIGSKALTPIHWCAICAHEMEHVSRMRKHGTLNFMYDYLASDNHRALYEADAEAASADMLKVLGKYPPVSAAVFTAEWSGTYSINERNTTRASKRYERLVSAHTRNLCATNTGSVVIDLLRGILK